MSVPKESVSIIIPFFNEEKNLAKALTSVFNQSYPNTEIILIDDGSTDASLDIALQYQNDHVKVISIPNQGPGIARNRGIAASSGDFIVFLDADDVLHPEMILKMVQNILKNQTDLAMCLFTIYGKNDLILKKSNWPFTEIFESKTAISLFVNGKFTPTVWGKIFKSSIARKCIFPTNFWKEDDVFILQYLLSAKKISIVNEHLIDIYGRTNSLTRQTISKKMIEAFSFSYQTQANLIDSCNDLSLNKALLMNELNVFSTVFLLIKIDFNSIENKKDLLVDYLHKITTLRKKIKEQKGGLKALLISTFLLSPKIVGWKIPLAFVSIFKKKEILTLKKIKTIQ